MVNRIEELGPSEPYLRLARQGKDVWNRWVRTGMDKYQAKEYGLSRIKPLDADEARALASKLHLEGLPGYDNAPRFDDVDFRQFLPTSYDSENYYCNSINFSGFVFGPPRDFSPQKIHIDEEPRVPIRRASVFFDGAHFGSGASFVGAKFGDLTSFHGARFEGSTRFDGAKFGAGTSFERATFGGLTSFNEVTFQLSFVDATLLYRPDDDAEITWDTNFRGATFGPVTEFNGATFGNGTVFNNATFGGPTRFAGATFGETTIFDGVRFEYETSFKGATFGPRTTFDCATFERGTFAAAKGGDIEFNGAAFGDETDFARVVFGRASFTGATFGGHTSFDGATFGHMTTFIGATFGRTTSFDSAKFGGDSAFDSLDEVKLRRLLEPLFSLPDSAPGHFRRDVWLAARKGWLDARVATAHPKIFLGITFHGAVFSGHSSFRNRTFEGAANFSEIAFGDPPDFAGSGGLDNLDLSGIEISFGGRKGVFREWTFDSTTEVRLRRFRKIAKDVEAYDLERDLFILERKAQRGIQFKRLFRRFDHPWKSVWNSGRIDRIKLKDNLRERNPLRPLGLVALLFFYGITSDCGHSVIRPLLWLVASFVGFHACYWQIYRSELHPRKFLDHDLVSFTLSNALPYINGLSEAHKHVLMRLFPYGQGQIQVPTAIEFLSIGQTITGAMLLFLLALAIRNRFRLG